MNPFHVPAGAAGGRGGQFDFASLHGYIPAIPGRGNTPFDIHPYTNNIEDVPQETIDGMEKDLSQSTPTVDEMRQTLARELASRGQKRDAGRLMGATDKEIQGMIDRATPLQLEKFAKTSIRYETQKREEEMKAQKGRPLTREEKDLLKNDVIREKHLMRIYGNQLGPAVRGAIEQYADTIQDGGHVGVLSHPHGSFTLTHGSKSAIGHMVDNLDNLGTGEALVYNQGTGVLRNTGNFVPIPGTQRTISTATKEASIRNRLGESAVRGPRDKERAAAKIEKFLAGDPSDDKSSFRKRGPEDNFGRVVTMVMRQPDGSLIIQSGMLFEDKESKEAKKAAERMGTEVVKPKRTQKAPSPQVGNSEMLRENDNYRTVDSSFGAPFEDDPAIDQMRNRLHDDRGAARVEVGLPEGPYSGLSQERKDQIQVGWHRRTAERNRARDELRVAKAKGTDQLPIHLDGGGYIHPGDTGYEEARKKAVAPQTSKTIGERYAAGEAVKIGREASEMDKKIRRRLDSKGASTARSRERNARKKQADAKGQRWAMYKKGNRKFLSVEGDEDFDYACENAIDKNF